MNEVEVNVVQTPCVILSFSHGQGMVSAIVIVPQLCRNEDVVALDNAFFDGSLYSLACFFRVLRFGSILKGSPQLRVSSAG